MDPRAFLDRLAADPSTADSLVHVRELPARAPVIEPFPDGLPELLVSRLGLTGVHGLYPHQSEGLAALRDGRDVVLATGTASGKTLVYNAAFAAAAIDTPKATALYLFPTKALARDQLRSIRALKLPQVKAAVYDGDTPKAERPLIRTNANLVMTNPDMLHLSLLADHARWADFFFRLSLVVGEERQVQHVGVRHHEVRVRSDQGALRLRRVAVVDGGLDLRQLQGTHRAQLVARERLRREQEQRRGFRDRECGVGERELVDERLPAGLSLIHI